MSSSAVPFTSSSASHRPTVVLVGPPGAGKTTIGRRLARALNLALVDTDELLEQESGMACGELFATVGEPRFRELEAAAVARALNVGGVLSLGGGAVLTESTRRLLEDHTVVWVDVSAAEGHRRTQSVDTRPVLAADDPLTHYERLLSAREGFYREVANVRVRSDLKTPQQLVADILSYLESLD